MSNNNRKRLRSLQERAEAERQKHSLIALQQDKLLKGNQIRQKREKTKKEQNKKSQRPFEVMNYIESCLREKDKLADTIEQQNLLQHSLISHQQQPHNGQNQSFISGFTNMNLNKQSIRQQIFAEHVKQQFEKSLNGGIASPKNTFFEDMTYKSEMEKEALDKEQDLNSKINLSVQRIVKRNPELCSSEYFETHKSHTHLPNTGETELKKKLQEKQDDLITIIRNCDTFREGFIDEQKDMRLQIEKCEDSLEVDHDELKKRTKSKKLLILKEDLNNGRNQNEYRVRQPYIEQFRRSLNIQRQVSDNDEIMIIEPQI
eukprot:403372350